jgi:hypothetical protein
MIVCDVCETVLYHGVMPANSAEIEFVACYDCEQRQALADWFENMAYDLANDR